MRDMERRLEPLLQLQDLVRTTDERLAQLNSLAIYVQQKVKDVIAGLTDGSVTTGVQ